LQCLQPEALNAVVPSAALRLAPMTPNAEPSDRVWVSNFSKIAKVLVPLQFLTIFKNTLTRN